MIEKKDWELILKNNEEEKAKLIKSYEMALPQFEAIILLAKHKISEFPADPAPAEVKEVIAEAVK